MEQSRMDANELISMIGRGLMAFQSIVRRNQAVGLYEIMRQDDRKRKIIDILAIALLRIVDGMDGYWSN